MANLDDYYAWRKRIRAMTAEQRKQLEINQWIWLRWFFSASACLFLWVGILIFKEGHEFSVIHYIALGVILWAVYKSWSLKFQRDRNQSASVK